jgi:hypothetical protein
LAGKLAKPMPRSNKMDKSGNRYDFNSKKYLNNENMIHRSPQGQDI